MFLWTGCCAELPCPPGRPRPCGRGSALLPQVPDAALGMSSLSREKWPSDRLNPLGFSSLQDLGLQSLTALTFLSPSNNGFLFTYLQLLSFFSAGILTQNTRTTLAGSVVFILGYFPFSFVSSPDGFIREHIPKIINSYYLHCYNSPCCQHLFLPSHCITFHVTHQSTKKSRWLHLNTYPKVIEPHFLHSHHAPGPRDLAPAPHADPYLVSRFHSCYFKIYSAHNLQKDNFFNVS